MEILKIIFTPGNFEPHIVHFFGNMWIVWGFYISNGMIALAYTIIPITLVYVIRKRKDIPFNWVFWAFALFIVMCGITHIMHIMIFTYPAYYLQLIVDILTGIISIITAAALIYIIPPILKVPNVTVFRETNEKLEKVNQVLQNEIAEHKKAKQELKKSTEELEKNKELEEKSKELQQFNELMTGRELKMVELKKEIVELKKENEALKQASLGKNSGQAG